MTAPRDLNSSQQFEEAENIGTNASANATMGDVIAERFSRRELLKGVLAVPSGTMRTETGLYDNGFVRL